MAGFSNKGTEKQGKRLKKAAKAVKPAAKEGRSKLKAFANKSNK